MAWAYTIIASVMAYSAGLGPSKLSVSYDVSVAVSCATTVKYCNSQMRCSNALTRQRCLW